MNKINSKDLFSKRYRDESIIDELIEKFNTNTYYSWVHKCLILESESDDKYSIKRFKYSKMINFDFINQSSLKNLFYYDLSDYKFEEESKKYICRSIKRYCKSYIKESSAKLIANTISYLNVDDPNITAKDLVERILSHSDLKRAAEFKFNNGNSSLLSLHRKNMNNYYDYEKIYPLYDCLSSKNSLNSMYNILDHNMDAKSTDLKKITKHIRGIYSLYISGFNVDLTEFDNTYERILKLEKSLKSYSISESVMLINDPYSYNVDKEMEIINSISGLELYKKLYEYHQKENTTN